MSQLILNQYWSSVLSWGWAVDWRIKRLALVSSHTFRWENWVGGSQSAIDEFRAWKMGQWKAVILIFSVLHLGISQVTEVGGEVIFSFTHFSKIINYLVNTDSKSELISNFFVRGPSVQIHSDSEPRSARRLRMSEACLACICLGSTNCQLATGCVSNGQYCGPFLISKPYWLDAGRPVLLGDSPEREGG